MDVPASIREDSSRDAVGRAGNVVDFPLGNRNVLARLANELNASAVATTTERNDGNQAAGALHVITLGSVPRLVIDSTSHVEHAEGQSLFRVTLGCRSDARVSLETSNYDKVKQFVCDYLEATRVPGPKAGARR